MISKNLDITIAPVEWERLENLASRLGKPGIEPGTIPNNDWQIIEVALKRLLTNQDFPSIVRLRRIFNSLYAHDTITDLEILGLLEENAIVAARLLGDKYELGHLLGSKGHNLHRQGHHLKAIQTFDESAQSYLEINENILSLKSYYMTSLCYRALGDRRKAKEILQDILEKTDPADPWRANPNQVMAWLLQDEGKLSDAEDLLRQCLSQYRKMTDADMLIAGALADLAEISGILGRHQEASDLFVTSLSIFSEHRGQFERQEARTLLKYSELLMHQKKFSSAKKLLNHADDKVSRYGHYYDLLWQIELAQAFIFLQEWDLPNCYLKMRSVFMVRHYLRLPPMLLVKHVVLRYAQRFWRARTTNHAG